MAGEILIKPDLQFVKRIMAAGGQDAKVCYQCDTCSVVCNLAPEERPFPRKEMLHAQWGLTDVVKSPDIWLCHQCSDCTVHCPRGAKPGEVLGVLRQMCIEHYAIPPMLARIVGDIRFLPVLIAFPVLLLLAALKVIGRLAIPEGPIVYAKMFPTLLIDFIFTGAAAFAVFVLAQGVIRYWRDINVSPWKVELKGSLWTNLGATLIDIVKHERFQKCETTYARWLNHLFVFLGFVALGCVTAWAAFREWILHYESPYPLFSWFKLLALAGTVLLIWGIYQVIQARKDNADKAGYGTYFDWQLIYVIAAVAVTGALSWIFRAFVPIKTLAYPIYFLHLTSIFFLFFYAPYTKIAHLVYRTVAMLYARMSDRGF